MMDNYAKFFQEVNSGKRATIDSESKDTVH